MSCSSAALMCEASSRTASSPAYSFGCSVLTRPPMISGNPVKSEIARSGTPASLSALAVPPVETISIPSSTSPRANSTTPVLSDTDSSARETRTSPGAVVGSPDIAAVSSIAMPTLPGDDHATRVLSVESHVTPRDQAHRLGQQLVLDRMQPSGHVLRPGGIGNLDRTLEDDRAGVDAAIHIMDGHA